MSDVLDIAAPSPATALAQRILDEQGYVVVAFAAGRGKNRRNPPKVGDVWHESACGGVMGEVPGPFKVVAVATGQEYIAQTKKYLGNAGRAVWFANRKVAFLRVVAE
jgi:hypothetical protein